MESVPLPSLRRDEVREGPEGGLSRRGAGPLDDVSVLELVLLTGAGFRNGILNGVLNDLPKDLFSPAAKHAAVST